MGIKMYSTNQVSTPKQNRYLGMTRMQCGILTVMGSAMVCIIGFLTIMLLLEWKKDDVLSQQQSASPQNQAVEIIFDIPSLLGMTVTEIRYKYSVIQGEELYQPEGFEDILPNGSKAEGYSTSKYSFDVFYNKYQNSIGVQIYNGVEELHYKINDWNIILLRLNIIVSRPPDTITEYRAQWNNESGYHIEIIRNLASQYVFNVIVVQEE